MNVASKYINYILLVCFFATLVSQSFAKSSTESFSSRNEKSYHSIHDNILLIGGEILAEDPEWEDEQDELCNHFIICNLFYSSLNKSHILSLNPIGVEQYNTNLIELSPAYIMHGVFRI